jgi:nicotinate-nucleotide pyrophosphorylase (carboxylating)
MNIDPNKPISPRLAILLAYLEEDAGRGDLTTVAMGIDSKCTAEIVAKQDCVLAGITTVTEVFGYFKVDFSIKRNDGQKCISGDVVLVLEGDGATILKLERLLLNVLARMTGIATATRDVVDRVSGVNPDCLVAATRKTTPGFRIFEKEAVMVGGGHPHRFDLEEAVMIKDNHLKFVDSPKEAIARVSEYIPGLPDVANRLQYGKGEPRLKKKWLEIEADSLETAEASVKAGADIVMLDNMSPAEAAEAYKKLKSLREDVKIEVSGGITPDNILDYAKSADIISLGWLTHSAPAADFSLKVIKVDPK